MPQLRLEIELHPGHIFFFQSSILVHYVRQLDDVNGDHCLGITIFTCNRLMKFFKDHVAATKSVDLSNSGHSSNRDNDLKDLDNPSLLCHFGPLNLDSASD